MRVRRILLGSVVGVFAVAALAYCCGRYGEAQTIVKKVNRPVQAAFVRDGQLYAVNDQSDLLTLAAPNGELRNLGKFEGKLLDITKGKACFAIKNLVYVADLANGKILASQIFENPHGKICFVGPDRLAVLKGSSVQILDAANAKTIHTFELRQSDKAPALNAIACQAEGDRLYVATGGNKAGIVVIDVPKNKIIDTIPTETGAFNGVREFHIHNGKALLVSHNEGHYGVWIYHASIVDLQTKKATMLKVPAELKTAGMVGPRRVFAIRSRRGSGRKLLPSSVPAAS